MSRKKLELEIEDRVCNELIKLAEPKGLTLQEYVRVILGDFVDTNSVNLHVELGKVVRNLPLVLGEFFKLRGLWQEWRSRKENK